MNTLLDISKYPNKAYEYMHNILLDGKFKCDYILDTKTANSAMGFLYDVVNTHKELKPHIEKMNKIAQLRSEKSKSKLEKITETWFKGAFYESFKQGFKVSRNYFIDFVMKIYMPQDETRKKALKASARKLFDNYVKLNRNKIKRVKTTQKLNDLKAQFPKYDIEKAYSYAVISGKFALKNDDIKDFMRIITLLKKNDKQ